MEVHQFLDSDYGEEDDDSKTLSSNAETRVVIAEVSSWKELHERYSMTRFAKFRDSEVEESFEKNVKSNKNSLHVFVKVAWVCIFLVFTSILKCILVDREFYHANFFGIAISLRVLIVLFYLALVSAFYIPRTSLMFVRHCNILIFCGLFFSCLIFSASIGMQKEETPRQLEYYAQATCIIFTCIIPRVSKTLKFLGNLCQIFIYFGISFTSGYDFLIILHTLLFLVVFMVVGFCALFVNEINMRNIFKEQQLVLYALNKQMTLSQDLARQAQQANDQKSQFVANISHEIRTPLHGVITALDLLKSTQLTREQTDYVQVAETSSSLLLDILNNVLTLSKLQAGKVALEMLPTDMREIVEGVSVVFSQLAAKKGVEIVSRVPPSLQSLLTDPVRLKQIFFNLVSNAVKFTSSGRIAILVDIESENEREVALKMSVCDTGAGIAQENLHLLFQRFSQVDDSTTRKLQGTGLGLALVCEIAKLFGGRVTAESEGLGHGTTISFFTTFQKIPTFSFSSTFHTTHHHHHHSNSLTVLPPPPPFSQELSQVDLPFSPTGNPNSCLSFILAPHWSSRVFHSDQFSKSIWENYLSHLGAEIVHDSSHVPVLLELYSFQTFGSISSAGGVQISCAPFCLFVNEKECHDLSVMEELRDVVEHVHKCTKLQKTQESTSSSLSSRLRSSFHTFPIFVILLQEPIHTATTGLARDILSQFSTTIRAQGIPSHFLSIKKPCRLSKLKDLAENMCEYLRKDFLISAQNVLSPNGGASKHSHRLSAQWTNAATQNSNETILIESQRTSVSPKNVSPRFTTPASQATTTSSEGLTSSTLFPITTTTATTTAGTMSRRASSDWTVLARLKHPESQLFTEFISQDSLCDLPSRAVSPTLYTNQQQHPQQQHLGVLIPSTASLSSSSLLTPSSLRRFSVSSSVDRALESVDCYRRVLIADDNPINRKLTERLLKKAGFACLCVENGAMAVEAVNSQQFGLIILDVHMPIMDGPTAAQTIKFNQSQQGIQKTPICGLSAAFNTSEVGPSPLSTENFDFVLCKPIKGSLLIEVAERLTTAYRDGTLPLMQ